MIKENDNGQANPYMSLVAVIAIAFASMIILGIIAYFSPPVKYDNTTTEYPLVDIQMRHYEGSSMPFDHSHDFYVAIYKTESGTVEEVHSDWWINFKLVLSNKSSVEHQKTVVNKTGEVSSERYIVNIQNYSQIRTIEARKNG